MEKRIRAFQQLGFGLFVHYGPYVQYESGEWAYELCRIDPKEYEKKALSCDYSSFDAEKIAAAAKSCGAKYVTFTTRHHDGFSLYDTRGLSDYDVVHMPNGRDLVREFVDACRRNDIVPFFYHTTLDWHHPDFENDFGRYQQYLRDSVRILCENYGPIGGFWFDGNWSKPAQLWEDDALYKVIRQSQPEAIIVNNTGLHAQGAFTHPEIDCVTFEQGTPKGWCSGKTQPGEKEYMGEMCYTLCWHWGIAQDIDIKSMRQILEAYTACRRVGGNFLLGIFTRLDASQPLLHQGYLEAIGQWVKRNEPALFDAVPGEAEGFGKDFMLENGNKRYAFIHDLSTSGDHNVLPGAKKGYSCFEHVTQKLKNAYWLDSKTPVEYTQDLANERLFVKMEPFSYGQNWVIRVAAFETESV